MDFKAGRKVSIGKRQPHPNLSARDKRSHLHDGIKGQHFGERDQALLELKYPHAIHFYDELPGCSLGLMEFETMALERLKVLRAVDKISSICQIKYNHEWAEKIDQELRHSDQSLIAYSYYGLDKASNRMAHRERDHFSHFILRLAYCRSEELRRWFISQECDLFRYRCLMAGSSLKEFIESNELHYTPVSEEELDGLRPLLMNLAFRQAGKEGPSSFYKVPFTEALDLVRTRKVYVSKGFCYVPDTEIVILVSWIFKSLLQQGLLLTYKVLPNLDEDERLTKVLLDLDKRYTGRDFNETDSDLSVTPDMIKPLSEKHFPLCMRAMQNTLGSTHHLKYKARLQYGLFLKGIGLSLEDAIKFFRGEFTQSHVDSDKFDKEYAYGIRYNYGKEGKKVNWAPWNCMRIIMDNVGPGENHGCPYRHYDPMVLSELLVKSGVEGDNLKNVLQLAKDGHYQKACALQFKAAHDGQEISSGITNHPNQFYMESLNGGSKPAGSQLKVKTERANLYVKEEQNEMSS